MQAYGQTNFSTTLTEKKRTIDSFTKLIDTNQELIKKHFIGNDLIYGKYKGNYLYDAQGICKLECTFVTDSFGMKVYYYHNDSLVKIIDKGTAFYYINSSLINTSGGETKTIETTKLLLFENNIRKNLKKMVSH